MHLIFKWGIRVSLILGLTLGIIFYPFFLIFCYLYLKLAELAGRKFANLGAPVNGVSTFLAIDKIFLKPSCTLVHLAVLDGSPEPSVVYKHFQAIYDLKNEKNGERIYEKLGFTLVPWCGYLFWKRIPEFDLNSCIHFIHEKDFGNGENLSEFVGHLIRKPFPKGGPLWEAFVVSNCLEFDSFGKKSQTPAYVLLRAHHVLMDGMSFVRFWYTASSVSSHQSAVTCPLPSSLFKYSASANLAKKSTNWGRNARIILCQTPYLSNKFICVPGDENCITKSFSKFSGSWYCSGVNKIQLESYRAALKQLGFSVTHALLVAYGRGLRRFIAENYGDGKIPKSVHIMGSVPRPNYPVEQALTNHWTIMRYKADLQQHGSWSLLEDLNYAKTTYGSAVKSLIPEAFALNHNSTMGLLPRKIAELLWDTKKTGTCSLSNIPGPPTPQQMFGFGVTDLSVWLPLSRYNSGIGLLFLTYNGWATISLTADSKCIGTKKKFQRFNETLMEEMETLLEQIKLTAEQCNNKFQVPDENANDLVQCDNSSELSQVKVV